MRNGDWFVGYCTIPVPLSYQIKGSNVALGVRAKVGVILK
jgi:hypothetical protein